MSVFAFHKRPIPATRSLRATRSCLEFSAWKLDLIWALVLGPWIFVLAGGANPRAFAHFCARMTPGLIRLRAAAGAQRLSRCGSHSRGWLCHHGIDRKSKHSIAWIPKFDD